MIVYSNVLIKKNRQLANHSLQEYFLRSWDSCFFFCLRNVWPKRDLKVGARGNVCKPHEHIITMVITVCLYPSSPGLDSFSSTVNDIQAHYPLQTNLFELSSSPQWDVHCLTYRLCLAWHTSVLGDNAQKAWLSYPGNGVYLSAPAYHILCI